MRKTHRDGRSCADAALKALMLRYLYLVSAASSVRVELTEA